MQELIARRPARSLIALVVLLTIAIGVTTSASQAADANCDIGGPTGEPTVTSPSEAGGYLVSFTTECTGNESVTRTVTVTQGAVILFKAVLQKEVNGRLLDTEQIHLPPLPTVEEICVEIEEEGQKVCVPPPSPA